MGKVIASITQSVDGCITGPDDGPEHGLGRGSAKSLAEADRAASGIAERQGRKPRRTRKCLAGQASFAVAHSLIVAHDRNGAAVQPGSFHQQPQSG